MVILSLILIIFSGATFAKSSAVITVLEAPVFKEANSKSKIIQYLHKGDIIYIHPQHFQNEDLKINEKDLKNYNTYYQDPLFNQNIIHKVDPLFLKTLDKNGHDAYILKEHAFIYFNDLREINQKKLTHDPTDYRLEEPLVKNYPLILSEESRGQLSLSLSRSRPSIYPYTKRIIDQSLDTEIGIELMWSNIVKWDKSLRLYFGGIIMLNKYNTELILENFRSIENNTKGSIGPYLSYDLWRSHNYRISSYSALPINLINKKVINLTSLSNNQETIEYDGISLDFLLGSQIQIYDIIPKFDLIIGLNGLMQLPTFYNLTTSNANSNNENFKENFTQSALTKLNFNIGFQSSF